MDAPQRSDPLPTLVAGAVVLRPSSDDDALPFLLMLAEPAVREWWGANTLESITDELAGHFTIIVDGAIAGLLECHQEIEPDYPGVAFDIFLGTAFHGRGIGRRVLRLAIDHFVAVGHHRFTIDPAVSNAAAVRCYAAVGFRPVGILRESERAPDGTWRDALLMDLLARELP